MPEITIRLARPEDAAGIARVNTLSWRQAYAGLLPEDFLAHREVTEEDSRQRMAALDSRTAVFVAQRGDEVVGFAVAGTPPAGEPLDLSVGLLYAMYLLVETWGTGVGYRLHHAVVTFLADAGFDSAALWVLDGNSRAIDFYVRQGWVADGHKRQEMLDGQVLNVRRYWLARLARSG